jgi:hypothetical protein
MFNSASDQRRNEQNEKERKRGAIAMLCVLPRACFAIYILLCKGLNFASCTLAGARNQPPCITAGTLVSAYAARHWAIELSFNILSPRIFQFPTCCCLMASLHMGIRISFLFFVLSTKDRILREAMCKAVRILAILLSCQVALFLHQSRSNRVHLQTVGAEIRSGLASTTNSAKGVSLLCTELPTDDHVLVALCLPSHCRQKRRLRVLLPSQKTVDWALENNNQTRESRRARA